MNVALHPSAPASAQHRRRRRVIAPLVALMVCVGLTLAAAPRPASATTAAEQDYVNRINNLRASLGLNPLTLDQNNEDVATNHTSWMIANNSFTHSTDLTAGITTPWLKLGENIGKGTNSDLIWSAFLNSPGHYANITDPSYTHVGIGVMVDSSGTQWTTQRFMQAKAPAVDPYAPFGSVDSFRWTGPGTMTVSGWAMDPDTPNPIQVAVYVDGAGVGWFNASASRPDVGAVYPWFGNNHGYSVPLSLAGGNHTVCVYGINVGQGSSNALIGCRTAWLATGAPIGSVDAAWSPGPGTLHVAGWAIDPDTSNATQVAVYIDGVGVGWFAANTPRADLAAAMPLGQYHGFEVGFPASGGTHSVCVYAINVLGGSGNPLLGCRTATVATGVPFGSVDSAFSPSPGIARLAGWTIDPDTATPTNIAVYVDGVGVSWFPSANARADVGAAYTGYGPYHGFDVSFAASGGTHTACVYAINVGGGSGNPLLGCRSVSLPTGNPFGSFDSLTRPTSTSLRVTGWSIDPDTASATKVAVYVDGVGVGWFASGNSRPDVANAFPGYGPSHGFDVTFAASSAKHTVCVYAINIGGGSANPSIGCRSV